MHAIPDSLCYLNGEFGPLAQARVSVLDRGFLFGDGVYEAMPVYGRRIFRFEEHMARLGRSLAKVRIANPLGSAEWLAMCRELIAAHAADDQLVYLQVTRGVAPRDHAMPVDVTPTVFAMTSPLRAPTAEQRHHGVECVTARDFRWERADIKSISLLGNVLARQMSVDHGGETGGSVREPGYGGR
ncbi:MAG: aminotransferase class IV, partial [Rhizobacter sp.]